MSASPFTVGLDGMPPELRENTVIADDLVRTAMLRCIDASVPLPLIANALFINGALALATIKDDGLRHNVASKLAEALVPLVEVKRQELLKERAESAAAKAPA